MTSGAPVRLISSPRARDRSAVNTCAPGRCAHPPQLRWSSSSRHASGAGALHAQHMARTANSEHQGVPRAPAPPATANHGLIVIAGRHSTSMASFRAVALLLSCLLASLLSLAEGHRWRGHGRLAKKSRPHKRPGVKITIRRKSHKRKHFKSRKPKCAKHLRICAGRLRTSKKACCQRKGDECRRFGKHISICFPKPRKPGASAPHLRARFWPLFRP